MDDPTPELRRHFQKLATILMSSEGAPNDARIKKGSPLEAVFRGIVNTFRRAWRPSENKQGSSSKASNKSTFKQDLMEMIESNADDMNQLGEIYAHVLHLDFADAAVNNESKKRVINTFLVGHELSERLLSEICDFGEQCVRSKDFVLAHSLFAAALEEISRFNEDCAALIEDVCAELSAVDDVSDEGRDAILTLGKMICETLRRTQSCKFSVILRVFRAAVRIPEMDWPEFGGVFAARIAFYASIGQRLEDARLPEGQSVGCAFLGEERPMIALQVGQELEMMWEEAHSVGSEAGKVHGIEFARLISDLVAERLEAGDEILTASDIWDLGRRASDHEEWQAAKRLQEYLVTHVELELDVLENMRRYELSLVQKGAVDEIIEELSELSAVIAEKARDVGVIIRRGAELDARNESRDSEENKFSVLGIYEDVSIREHLERMEDVLSKEANEISSRCAQRITTVKRKGRIDTRSVASSMRGSVTSSRVSEAEKVRAGRFMTPEETRWLSCLEMLAGAIYIQSVESICGRINVAILAGDFDIARELRGKIAQRRTEYSNRATIVRRRAVDTADIETVREVEDHIKHIDASTHREIEECVAGQLRVSITKQIRRFKADCAAVEKSAEDTCRVLTEEHDKICGELDTQIHFPSLVALQLERSVAKKRESSKDTRDSLCSQKRVRTLRAAKMYEDAKRVEVEAFEANTTDCKERLDRVDDSFNKKRDQMLTIQRRELQTLHDNVESLKTNTIEDKQKKVRDLVHCVSAWIIAEEARHVKFATQMLPLTRKEGNDIQKSYSNVTLETTTANGFVYKNGRYTIAIV